MSRGIYYPNLVMTDSSGVQGGPEHKVDEVKRLHVELLERELVTKIVVVDYWMAEENRKHPNSRELSIIKAGVKLFLYYSGQELTLHRQNYKDIW